jgi:hypothetical protein
MNEKSVCLICRTPNTLWLEFLSTFKAYDIYVIVDDNSKEYKFPEYSNIHIIQINNSECEHSGFCNTCLTLRKKLTGWGKALYYFSSINSNVYNYIWFFEDDVFFNSEETLTNIDTQYINSDLLSSKYFVNETGHTSNWHWRDVHIKNFSPPYYCAMICCVRMSKELVSKIKEYAYEHKTLFFTEALFPTLCMQYNLQYDTPDELTNVVFQKDYIDEEIHKINVYHPVKDITKHTYYRNKLLKTI